PLAFDFVRSWYGRLDTLDWERANALLAEMEGEGGALLGSSGVARRQVQHRRLADMRYVGQGHEVRVPLPGGRLGAEHVATLQREFERVYRELYGRQGPPVPVEVINWRVVSSGPRPELKLDASGNGAGAAPADEGHPALAEAALKGTRPAYFPEHGGYVETPVYDRYRLGPGAALLGPAIVEERESTLI